MVGRPPKSTDQHKADGTYNVTRHRDRVEDQSFDGEIDVAAPDDLGEVGAATWDRVVSTFPKDQLRFVDWDGLRWMCFWNGEAWNLAMRLQGMDVGQEGYRKVQMATIDAYKQFVTFAAKFGMSPADRAKLRMLPVAQKDDDPFAKLAAIEDEDAA